MVWSLRSIINSKKNCFQVHYLQQAIKLLKETPTISTICSSLASYYHVYQLKSVNKATE